MEHLCDIIYMSVYSGYRYISSIMHCPTYMHLFPFYVYRNYLIFFMLRIYNKEK